MGSVPTDREAQAAAWLPLPRPVPGRWPLFALLALLLVARQPDDFAHPEFTAEEGAIFFQQAYNEGFWASLLSPTSGYFHLALRLTAGLALLLPLELAPLVFKVAALAIQMLPVAYLLADGVPGFVATPLLRVLTAAVYVAGPNTTEIYLNVLNSQWHLTFAACLILLAAPRPGKLRRALDAGVLLLFATSGPFSLVCAPLALWSWQRTWRARASRTRNLEAVIVLAGAAMQLSFLVTGSRAASAAAFRLPAPAEMLRIIGLHGVCNGLLGRMFTTRHHQAFPAGTALVAAALLPVLAVAALRLRNRALLVLFGLATASMTVMFLFPLNDPRLWLEPSFGSRYFFFSMLAVLFTLFAMAERGGWWRRLAAPGLAAALFIGVRGDYRVPPAADTHWPDQVAVFRSLPPGADFFIPVGPQPSSWGLTLRRKEHPAAAAAFGRYPTTAAPTASVLDPVRSTLPPDDLSPEQKYVFSGSAADATTGDTAGAVFLQLDGRLFPAATWPASESLRPGPASVTNFARFVPRSTLGPGAHSARVLVLNHAGTALLAPGPITTFTLP